MKILKPESVLKAEVDKLSDEDYSIYNHHNILCASAMGATMDNPSSLQNRRTYIEALNKQLKFLEERNMSEAEHVKLLITQAEAEYAYVNVLSAGGYSELINPYTNAFPMVYDEALVIMIESESRKIDTPEITRKKDPNPNIN